MKLAEYKKVQAYVSTENDEGSLLASYLLELMDEGKVIEFSHIPSSLRTPYLGVLRKMKLQGWRKGMPDYFIITKRNVIFIELKISKGGTLSPEQKLWLDALTQTGKVHATRCNGFFDAKRYIETILASEV